ncbi:hypothetical protein [Geoglobus sp.]
MDEEEIVNKTMTLLAVILTFVAVIGLYFNINSLIGMYLDYRKSVIVSILFNIGILVTAMYLFERLRKS